MSETNAKEGEEECFSGAGKCNSSLLRINLTTDSMRWDSLKIHPSTEFGEKILQKFPFATLEALQQWQPIELLLHDADINENYSVKLAKKEPFWFEPLPDVGQKKNGKAATMEESSRNELKEFVYCLQPFRHVIKKRSLSYGQEIGLVWSGCKLVNRVDFSVLHNAPNFGSYSFKRQGYA